MNRSESRYFSTAAKMDEALINLLEKKDFEYITVKEVCEKAGVNRSTFYLHYENTRDLLQEATQYLLDRFWSYFPESRMGLAGQIRHAELEELVFVTEEYLRPYLRYIRENRRMMKTVMKQASSFGFEGIYRRLFSHIFDPILERFGCPEEERGYRMYFYLSGISAVVMKWVEADCAQEDEWIGNIIVQCVLAGSDTIPQNRK